MVIIADSGSTKTDWALTDGKDFRCVKTQGINPVLMDSEAIAEVVRGELLPQLGTSKVEAVHFYGAGVRDDMKQKMAEAFASVIDCTDMKFHSDLLGAAHALCGHQEGIACILGTGANSCLYDGRQIVANTPALGFILGDEGGGAALGKRFLNAIFKGELPAEVRDAYLESTHLTLADIIRKVYREPMPNRFLASTSLFIGQHIEREDVRQLVVENFRLFFRRNIVPYGRRDLAVNFVGSVAFYYENLLREAAREERFEVGAIMKSPLEGLVSYVMSIPL